MGRGGTLSGAQWVEPQMESTEIHQRFTDNDGDDDLMTLICDDDL